MNTGMNHKNIWRNSSMETFYGSDYASGESSCEVRIQGGELVISYEGEKGPVIYRGMEEGDGHFRLTATEVKGRGTLHRFAGDDILEGFWSEDGAVGMWRITLEE